MYVLYLTPGATGLPGGPGTGGPRGFDGQQGATGFPGSPGVPGARGNPFTNVLIPRSSCLLLCYKSVRLF